MPACPTAGDALALRRFRWRARRRREGASIARVRRRAILWVGPPEDDHEGWLELRPWPDASAEEKAIIARIELCQSAWIGPRELLKHFERTPEQ
jgi:hypothetical protein